MGGVGGGGDCRMIIDAPGRITDHIVLLGRKESCVYLIDGIGECALIGGGMAHIVPDLLDQLNEFKIDEKRIKRILILHAHFDHCGIVPFFKKRWPWATVTASEKAKSLLSRPDVIESIADLSQQVVERYGREKEAQELGLSFSGIDVEQTVKDGDRIDCGGLGINILDVPGHSSCSIAAYMPEDKALFASDAGGIPAGDKIFTAANSDFNLYQQSLQKMAELDIDIVLAEHRGAVFGTDARSYLKKSIESAADVRKRIENSYQTTRDEKRSTEEMTDFLMKEYAVDFLPRDIFAIVVGQMVHFIAKSWGPV